jgi:hypothetical protein
LFVYFLFFSFFFFLPKSWEIYITEMGSSLAFQLFFILSLTHEHKNMLCLLICWQCWSNLTSLTLSSVKLPWLCLTMKGSKSVETLFQNVYCVIFEQCLLPWSLGLKGMALDLLREFRTNGHFVSLNDSFSRPPSVLRQHRLPTFEI